MSTNNRLDLNRRAFLAAVPAVCAAPLLACGEEKLAVDGGTPVRTTKLHTECPGTQFYDDRERTELMEAYDSHGLFRF